MVIKDACTAEEWERIVLAPMLASFAVTAADPSGLLGVIRESSAAARAMNAARETADPLIGEVMAAYDSAEGRRAAQDAITDLARGRTPEEATAEAIARISGISRLLDRKDLEATAFRDWLRDIAREVAEASSEGGFLGFGGEKVSDAEKRTLDEIDGALSLGIG
jgi:hypothetical protein